MHRLGGEGGKRLAACYLKCREIVLEYYVMYLDYSVVFLIFKNAVSYINDTSSCSCNPGERELLSAPLPYNMDM